MMHSLENRHQQHYDHNDVEEQEMKMLVHQKHRPGQEWQYIPGDPVRMERVMFHQAVALNHNLKTNRRLIIIVTH
jgi:hypothetical protein